MGWDGGGGCKIILIVSNVDVYMVIIVCNDFVYYFIVGFRYWEYMLYGCYNINVIWLL